MESSTEKQGGRASLDLNRKSPEKLKGIRVKKRNRSRKKGGEAEKSRKE